MGITKGEAEGALGDVAAVAEAARRRAFFKGPDALYMIWGSVWLAAFAFAQFLGGRMLVFGTQRIPSECFVWWPFTILGIVGSLVVSRRRFAVRHEGGFRIGAFWGVLFAYFYVFIFLLWPLVDVRAFYSPEGMRLLTAAVCILIMFAYVVMGLFGCGNYMIWLGAGVTVATVLGLLLVPHFFYLWMAVFGGGALFAAGVLTRRRWKLS